MPRTYVPFYPTFYFIKLQVQIPLHGGDNLFDSFGGVDVEVYDVL